MVAVVVVRSAQFFGWYIPQYGAADTRLVAQAFYIGVAAMGLNLLTGYNGQVSIGHGAFFGFGVYTTALLMEPVHVARRHLRSHVVPRDAAGRRGVSFVAGVLVGFPALRVKGLYLALVTLGSR